MTSTLRQHCDELQTALAELIRPELEQHKRGGPFIVLGSQTGLTCDGSFYGLTSAKMAIWLCDEIPHWRNGPCWLLNDSPIITDCGGCLEAAAMAVNAVSCHELAHCLQVPGLCADPDSATDQRGTDLFPLALGDMRPAAQFAIDIDLQRHGPNFIRTALHVRWRMIQNGWLVPFLEVLAWEKYCEHPPEWVRTSLRNEFPALAAMPLAALRHVPPPAEFSKLFEGSASVAESRFWTGNEGKNCDANFGKTDISPS